MYDKRGGKRFVFELLPKCQVWEVGFTEHSPCPLNRDLQLIPKRNYDFMMEYRNVLEVL